MVKDNALINASYHLELSEQRLILLAIVNARRNRQAITVSEPVTVTASEYAKEFGVSPQTANEVIKSASNNLFERQFGYKEWLEQEQDWKIVRSRWVSRIEQINNTGAIKLFFSHEVVRFTQELEKTLQATIWNRSQSLQANTPLDCTRSFWRGNQLAKRLKYLYKI